MNRAQEVLDRIKGPVVPLNLCFNADGTVDFRAVAEYVNWLCEQRTPVIMTTAGSSEFRALSDEDIWKLTEVVAGVTRGRAVFIASTGWWQPSRCREFLRHADRCGADAVKVQIHIWYPKDRRTLVAYFDALDGASDIPLLLWGHAPPPFPVDVAVELSQRPNIIGMKNDGDPFYEFYDLIRKTRGNDFALISGGQMRNFVYGYQLGAAAYLCTIAPFRPDIANQFYSLLVQKRYDDAWQMVFKYEERWLQVALEVDWLAAIKSALLLHGLYPNNRPSPPVPEVAPESVEKVRTILERTFGAIGRAPCARRFLDPRHLG